MTELTPEQELELEIRLTEADMKTEQQKFDEAVELRDKYEERVQRHYAEKSRLQTKLLKLLTAKSEAKGAA